eukprot:Tamp_12036.p3 GENE.Tamp_12036~~Tamp_12036.p3  ORF type:complete len:121 (-),score=7.95 Tamp_12036:837-1199(-)
MAQRMRTSVEKLYRSYFKIHSSPEDLVKVKIDPEIALETNALVGTTSDNAFLVRENMNYNRIKVKKEPGLEDEQVVTPAVPKILFRYGELIRLSPGGGGRCGRGRGMGGQDGLRAGADAR